MSICVLSSCLFSMTQAQAQLSLFRAFKAEIGKVFPFTWPSCLPRYCVCVSKKWLWPVVVICCASSSPMHKQWDKQRMRGNIGQQETDVDACQFSFSSLLIEIKCAQVFSCYQTKATCWGKGTEFSLVNVTNIVRQKLQQQSFHNLSFTQSPTK